MPCPSQMVEDEEEGSQVNSARRWLLTPPLLELLPAVANGKKSKQTSMDVSTVASSARGLCNFASQCNVIREFNISRLLTCSTNVSF